MAAFKKIAGVILIVIGIAALVTPLTPGAWLVFIGLELCGVRLLGKEQISAWWKRIRGVST